MNYEKICKSACELAIQAGSFIRDQQRLISSEKIETKGLHNYVTYVDKTAEKKLVEGLLKLLPESGFIVEEETIKKTDEKFNWIIDPLDGTTNYIHGLPPFAVSIGLREHDEMVAGVIYEVSHDECFYAWKGSRAYLNEKEIHVSDITKVTDSLIATGFPYYNYNRLAKFLATIEYFMKNSHGLRRLGSAATDMAYVACGRFEAFYEYGLSPWDVAAGALIVERAGGTVTDFNGGLDYIFGKELVSSNTHIHEEFFSIIKEMMR
ncbi:MAG: inositol monophosphatase [Bacteroidia bacterium]|nr:inositol monophosphatase [Bacteroidia bacterium]